jgi:hypothetical protein
MAQCGGARATGRKHSAQPVPLDYISPRELAVHVIGERAVAG